MSKKERPVNMTSHEVSAILAGHTFELRFLVKPQPPKGHAFQGWVSSSTSGRDIGKAVWGVGNTPLLQDVIRVRCPFGAVGDRLWVRETFDPIYGQNPPDQVIEIDYKADNPPYRMMDELGTRRWRPSVHMPRWASRITLEITALRVAYEYGVWVWVVGFKRIDGGAA